MGLGRILKKSPRDDCFSASMTVVDKMGVKIASSGRTGEQEIRMQTVFQRPARTNRLFRVALILISCFIDARANSEPTKGAVVQRDTQYYLTILSERPAHNKRQLDELIGEMRKDGINDSLKQALIRCLRHEKDLVILRNAILVSSHSDEMTTHLLARLQLQNQLKPHQDPIKKELLTGMRHIRSAYKVQYYRYRLACEGSDAYAGMLYRELYYEGIVYGDPKSLDFILGQLREPTCPHDMSLKDIHQNKLMLLNMLSLYPCQRSASYLVEECARANDSDEVIACMNSIENLARQNLPIMERESNTIIMCFPIPLKEIRPNVLLDKDEMKLKRNDCELYESIILLKRDSENEAIRRSVIEIAGGMGTRKCYDTLKSMLLKEKSAELRQLISAKLKTYLDFIEE